MDTATLDFNTVTLMVTIAGSWLTLVGLIIYQSNRLDNKIDTKIDALDNKFTFELRAVHGEFKIVRREISVVGERLARVEGHLMGPESFSPSPLSTPTDEPGDGEREAG